MKRGGARARSRRCPLTPLTSSLPGRDDITLVSVKVNGTPFPTHEVTAGGAKLVLTALPAGPIDLEIVTSLAPASNTSLEGLYVSGGNFCTQCEAEGFRGITFFPDRPDVMARYTTRLEADAAACPVLLSNGNLVDSGDAGGGRHYAVWDDPFPKPCYLFALVAGALARTADTFTTASGRAVDLHFYTEAKDASKTGYAIESLKKAMRWDEETYGLEYDLDLFNVVAVSDFVMGAMENKSLNIFNSRLVLASPATASDGDYARIEGVVGHEYFHNWTGNRVTCRDWFQLTLKEGLTVYRDQEFSADCNSRAVKRIEDVARLRAAQFPEDAGAMAHPIRPDSYIKMDNFYTLTVYEKGAEVVRMYAALLGKDGFRKGMDLYFQRHDGAAVTCDDFRAAMADANGVNLDAFGAWYAQAGTPEVVVETAHDAAAGTFTITATQSTPPTPGQPAKGPVPIPIAVGLLGADGRDLPLALASGGGAAGALPTGVTTAVLLLDGETATWTFTGVPGRPVPSLLRGFSAPVKLAVPGATESDLLFQLAHDADEFNRWEAGQRLLRGLMARLYSAATAAGADADAGYAAAGGVPAGLTAAFKSILTDASLDGAFAAAALALPAASELVAEIDDADPVLLHALRKKVVKELATQARAELEAAVAANDDDPAAPYSPAFAAAARRALKNKALAYLSALDNPAIRQGLLARCRAATNMTDRVAALAALVDAPSPERDTALAEFHADYADEPLALLKWLALQAGCDAPGNVAAARALADHPAFSPTNPNCCYSLYLAFQRSAVNFHAADGSGYAFAADAVLAVDRVNKQVAARIAGGFTSWRRYDPARRALMQAQLRRILEAGPSENVFEIVSKSVEK